MLLGFNPEAPDLFRIIRTSTGFSGETDIIFMPNSRGFLSNTFLDSSPIFTGLPSQVVVTGNDGKIDCDFLNTTAGVPDNVVLYDANGLVPVPDVMFITGNNGLPNQIVATTLSGNIDRSFIPAIRNFNAVSGQLIETNSAGNLDESFIERITTSNSMADQLIATDPMGFLDNSFLNSTAIAGIADAPIFTNASGMLDPDFLSTANANSFTGNQFVLTNVDGYVDDSFIETVITNTGVVGAIIASDTGGFIDNSFINFISSADPANRLASASMPVMTNTAGFIDASLVSLTADQTSNGNAGQIVSTTTGGVIDNSFYSSISSFNGTAGLLVATGTGGTIDRNFVPTGQTRTANLENVIPATLANGFLSSTFLPTTDNVGSPGSFLLANSRGFVDRTLIERIEFRNSSTGQGEIISTNSSGMLDDSFVPRIQSRVGTASGIVESVTGTGFIDLSFFDLYSPGDTTANKFVVTQTGGTIAPELFVTTIGPLANTIVQTGTNGFLDVAILRGVSANSGALGANRPIISNSSGLIERQLVDTSNIRIANHDATIPATGADGYLSSSFLRTTTGVGNAGDIFTAGSDGRLDSAVVRSTQVRSNTTAAGQLVGLNADTFVDFSLLNQSETRVADESRVVVSRAIDGRIDQGYLDKHIIGNTDELKVVVTGPGGFIDRAIVPSSAVPLANAIVSTGADTFIDTAFLNGVSTDTGEAGRPVLTSTGGSLDISLIPDDVLSRGVSERDSDNPATSFSLLTDDEGFLSDSFIRTRIAPSSTASENVNVLIRSDSTGLIDGDWIASVNSFSSTGGQLIRTAANGRIDNGLLSTSTTGVAGNLVAFSADGFIDHRALNGVSSLPTANLANRPILTNEAGLVPSDLIPSSFGVDSISTPNGMAGELVQTSVGGLFNRGFIPSVSTLADTPADHANSLLALNAAGFVDTPLLNGLNTRIGGVTGAGRVVVTDANSNIDTRFLDSILDNPTASNLVVLTEVGNQIAASRVQSISSRPISNFANMLVNTGTTGFIDNSLLNTSVSRGSDNFGNRLIQSSSLGFIDLAWLSRSSTRPASGDFVFAPRTDRYLDESFINAATSSTDITSGQSRLIFATDSGIDSSLTTPSIISNSSATRTETSGSRILISNGDNHLDLSYLRTAETFTTGRNLVLTPSSGFINLNQISNAASSGDAPSGKLVRIADDATTISQDLLPPGFGSPSSISSPNGMADQFIVTQTGGLIDQAFIDAVSDPSTLDEDARGNLLYRTQASGRFHPDVMAYESVAAFIPNRRDLIPITTSTGHIDSNLLVTVDTFNSANPSQIVRTNSASRLDMSLIPFVTANATSSSIIATTSTGVIDNSLITTIASAASTLTDGANTIVTTGSSGLINSSLTNPGILADAATTRTDITDGTMRLLRSNSERYLDTSLIDTADAFVASAKVVLTGSDGFINTNQLQTTTVGGVEAAEGRIVRLGNSARTLPTSLMPFSFAQIATGASNVVPLTDTTGNISVTYFNTITISSGNASLDRNRIVITNAQGRIDDSLVASSVADQAINEFTATNGTARLVRTNDEGILDVSLTPQSNVVIAATLNAGENLIKGTPIAFAINDMGMPTAMGASNTSDVVEGIALEDADINTEVSIVTSGLIMDIDSSLLPGASQTALAGELFLGNSNYLSSLPETLTPGMTVQRLGRRVGNSIVVNILPPATAA